MWAFGCLAYELLTTQPPFHAYVKKGGLALFNAICNEPVPPISGDWSTTMKDFVEKCLIKNRDERWTIKQLLGHELFNNVEDCKSHWVEKF